MHVRHRCAGMAGQAWRRRPSLSAPETLRAGSRWSALSPWRSCATVLRIADEGLARAGEVSYGRDDVDDRTGLDLGPGQAATARIAVVPPSVWICPRRERVVPERMMNFQGLASLPPATGRSVTEGRRA
jgi:hypothetical protein